MALAASPVMALSERQSHVSQDRKKRFQTIVAALGNEEIAL
jgi:hypothetical protein